jgi:hypothetical protein
VRSAELYRVNCSARSSLCAADMELPPLMTTRRKLACIVTTVPEHPASALSVLPAPAGASALVVV